MIPTTPAPPTPVANPPVAPTGLEATPPAVAPPTVANTGPKPRPTPAPAIVKPALPRPRPAPPVVVATRTKPATSAPPPPAAAPIPSEPQKQLSQATIRQMMLSSESGWKSCVKDAFGSNLSIGIVVGSNGLVQKADILGPLSQSATGRCITAEIRKLRFPSFTEGGATKQFFWSYLIPAS
jgi:hypothetical protein